ncbi:OmpA family protein [Desulforhopalus vacuolatus]|uniref:OmpA family protein n=1 Tax=Desulforhopalus vacuolatus TaxID=40414 RepID=UPI00196630B4|nr:OmpA family protein [Desulforhopalus vacuolatus]MBM9520137.1 OmpA family protein [Desulforhopalus vacuolatus]
MFTLKFALPVLLCVSALTLAGCSGTKPVPVEPQVIDETETIGVVESLDSIPLTTGIGEGRTTKGMLPVYFAFDSFGIPADQIPRMEENASYMKKNGTVSVRIEGNCDPRGTKEYNMALGERRALTAKNCLQRLGIGAERLSTVSYGKEQLLFSGYDEMGWAQDRRDDFVVDGSASMNSAQGENEQ